VSLEFRLLGDPIEHSLSPVIHAAGFAARGIDAVYRAVRVRARGLESALTEAADGGGGNVTLPHKRSVVAWIDEPGDTVVATGACNCFWRAADGGIAGDNTDVAGFSAGLAELGVRPVGTRALVLGAGGAARAVVHALRVSGVDGIDVFNRSIPAALELAEEVDRDVGLLTSRPMAGRWDLVVNATCLGLAADDPLPLDLERVGAGAVFDLVYGANETALVRWARRLGIPACDGTAMLVHQAAFSFARWFPGVEPPISEMRSAALTAVRGP
jgi:shikimate dehydrogenase